MEKTSDQLTKSYLTIEHLSRAQSQIIEHKGQLKRFKQWCKTEAIQRARAFSPDDLFAYRAYLSEQCGLSKKSIYNETIVIKQLIKWAAKNGYLSRNLLEPIRFEKVKSPKQPCFTIEQVELLIFNAEGWAVSIFATLAFTGMHKLL